MMRLKEVQIMAKPKTLNMDKLKSSVKKSAADHKDLKVRIKQAVNDGEHKAADTAIRLLTKTRDGLQKLLEHVEGHSNKAKAKAEAGANKAI